VRSNSRDGGKLEILAINEIIEEKEKGREKRQKEGEERDFCGVTEVRRGAAEKVQRRGATVEVQQRGALVEAQQRKRGST